MPRSKNPNPRQVTEEEERKAAAESESGTKSQTEETIQEEEDANDIMKIDLGGGDSPNPAERDSPVSEDVAAKRDSLAMLTARKFAAIYNAGDDSENEIQRDGSPFSALDEACADDLVIDFDNDSAAPEARTSLNFSPSSPPSFFVMGNKSRPPPPLRRMVEPNRKVNGESPILLKNKAKAPKPKGGSPSGMLNPEITRWMRSRFEMKAGGRISASDIIQIYNKDTRDLPDPPPTLQNYQVGQCLRRIFPSIERCKITVNGKRVWVYRHLSLIDPPLNLDGDDNGSPVMDSKENSVCGDDLTSDERMYDSPMSVNELEDPEIGDEGDSRPGSTGDETEKGVDSKIIKKEKNNTILLGLLGQNSIRQRNSVSPTDLKDSVRENSPNLVEKNDEGETVVPMRKKRDSEVVDWLLGNYKFKTGFFVKSMDLLRRYNDGREELVKYLSQVGRVMKHVFPGVRHLRKSFKGGKREWVYLNLKPIDVDSDGEEGQKMQMPMMRRVVRHDRFENGAATNNFNKSGNWKNESVNITHMPLSQNRNAIFKARPSVYHSVSRIDGNKLIISRNANTSPVKQERPVHQFQGNVPRLKETSNSSPNRTRIILYNKQRDLDKSHGQVSDDCRAPNDLERDIFAPFTKINQCSSHTSTHTQSLQRQTQYLLSGKRDDEENATEHSVEWPSSSNSGVFLKLTSALGKRRSSSPDPNQEESDSHWASKRLRLCATETVVNSLGDVKDAKDTKDDSEDVAEVGLDLSIKPDPVSSSGTQTECCETTDNNHDLKHLKEMSDDTGDSASDEVLNLTKYSKKVDAASPVRNVVPGTHVSPTKSQTIHYKPSKEDISTPANSSKTSPGGTPITVTSVRTLNQTEFLNGRFAPVKRESGGILGKFLSESNQENDQKRKFVAIVRKPHESLSWESLQNFNAQRYGWLRSPHTSWTTSKTGENGGKKVLRFVEWFLFSGQWLVDRQRALREIKIYDDWTVVIHALGRRVYPNDLGGITDLEKTTESLNKVFRVLAEAKLCMGFPAPCVSDLHIHGILVSKFEVWSSREDNGEDIRQRAVNCQILYSSPGSCCNKCARIMRLHQQQKRGAGLIKRSSNADYGSSQQNAPQALVK